MLEIVEMGPVPSPALCMSQAQKPTGSPRTYRYAAPQIIQALHILDRTQHGTAKHEANDRRHSTTPHMAPHDAPRTTPRLALKGELRARKRALPMQGQVVRMCEHAWCVRERVVIVCKYCVHAYKHVVPEARGI